MVNMIARLTAEQSAAILADESGQPPRVEDEHGKVYFLVSAEDMSQLWSQYLDAEIAEGLADVKAGNLVDWDPEKLKQLARSVAAHTNAR
jgi:hypothetical protein